MRCPKNSPDTSSAVPTAPTAIKNVPVGLRRLLGRTQSTDSWVTATGSDGKPAARAWANRTLFDQEGEVCQTKKPRDPQGCPGEEVAELVLANAVPEYSEIEDDLNDLGRRLKKSGLPKLWWSRYTGRQEGRGYPRHSPERLCDLQERCILLRAGNRAAC